MGFLVEDVGFGVLGDFWRVTYIYSGDTGGGCDECRIGGKNLDDGPENG